MHHAAGTVVSSDNLGSVRPSIRQQFTTGP